MFIDNLTTAILVFIIAYQIRSIYLGFKAPNILPEEIQILKKETKGKIELIDVRSSRKFNKDHIKGSKNIHLPVLSNNIQKLPKNKKIVLISSLGTQTGLTTTKLLKEGFDAVNLRGGYRAWTKYQKD